jgi:integrase
MALETAMRQGEILALKRSDIRGSVARVADSKNGHSRAVALSSRAQAFFNKRAADPDSPLFPIGQDSLEYYWRKACGLAKIKDLHFHDLRHQAVSRLFEKGLTTEEVMGMSGHRTYTMLARYTNLRPSSLADKLGDHFHISSF